MIVLDTHVWVWLAVAPERISPTAQGALEAGGERRISVMSCWEIGMLVAAGRMSVDRSLDEWVPRSLLMHALDTVDIDAGIALRAAGLYAMGFRADPADLLIAATALEFDAPIVSSDRRMRHVPDLTVVW